MNDALYMRAIRIPSPPLGARVKGTAEELSPQ